MLDEAQREYMGDFSPNVRPIPAMRARLLAAMGNVSQALGWAREQGLWIDDNLSYVREFEHITLAKVLLARHTIEGDKSSLNDANRLLRRLLTATEAGGRNGSVIEILVLQALAHHAEGDSLGAFAPLERALTLAEPEGYVRVFAGEGPPMVSLLTAVASRQAEWDYVHRLLAACTLDGARVTATRPGELAPRASTGLIDPLSERELDVLRLLATDLDGPAIAQRLFVSVNTMRTHTKSIYAKLGVNSRRAAVRRAEEHGLL
jgi:LuxR family maltose regulon positive regulatory protein